MPIEALTKFIGVEHTLDANHSVNLDLYKSMQSSAKNKCEIGVLPQAILNLEISLEDATWLMREDTPLAHRM